MKVKIANSETGFKIASYTSIKKECRDNKQYRRIFAFEVAKLE